MRTQYEHRRLFFKGRRQAAGFSLVELIVIIGVIAILAMIAVPNLTTIMARQKMRGQAMDAMTMMRQARLDAAMTSKPVRVVLDCDSAPACILRSQVALYQQGAVDGWADMPGKRSVFDEQVRAERAEPVGTSPDGGTSGNIAWIIFTPDGRAFSNPRPFGLYFFHSAYRDSMSGWRLTVNNNSGRAALSGHTQ